MTVRDMTCPDCGSVNIRFAIAPDWKDWPVCRDCKWNLRPLKAWRSREDRAWKRSSGKD